MDKTDFGKLNLEETFRTLGCNAGGLSSAEAEERIAKYGYNEIPEKRGNRLLKLALYFWGPMPWMIEAAAVLSSVLRHWGDFAIIVALLLVNAVIGFWQESKAGNAVELLRKRLAISARVLRGGNWSMIPSRELVPGDIVRVRLGDIVPADIKIMNGDYLLLDESALTGESLPAEKHRLDVTFSGAIVKQGEVDAVVTATGQNTYFGETAKLVQQAKTRSHLQKAVVHIGNYLIMMALALVVLVVLVSVARGQDLLSTVQFALVLLVASIPVALPAVLSVTLAVGAVALAQREAIVTRLEAIEETAGMDILCVDKTGTITRNEISVAEVKGVGGFSGMEAVGLAAIASRREDNDPIESAIFKSLESEGSIGTVRRYRVTGYKPFDPVSKRTEATCIETGTGQMVVVTKGAPQVIFRLASSDQRALEGAERAVEGFAAKGYRTIAVAVVEGKGSARLAGLLALYDPPRDDAKGTISSAESMGVDVKMVTGDHAAIAYEMCREVGIGTNIMRASSFGDSPESVSEMERADAFAEVFPEHKYNIVKGLQGRGHIVGMTGDGVNDAPALKEADAGIAVSNATDAARSAADIVLTAPGISVIIDAIKQSRVIFERMNSYAMYRIAETIRVLLFITIAIVLFNIYPLSVLMLVLLALLNDIPIMMIAYDNARIHDKPVRWNMRAVLNTSTLLGVMGLLSSFGMLLLGIYFFKLNFQTLQTLMFLKMAVAGHMTIYLTRSGRKHFWSRPFPSPKLFITTEATQAIATLFVVGGFLLAPLPWALALFVWGYSLVFLVLNDYIKVFFVRMWSRKESAAGVAVTV